MGEGFWVLLWDGYRSPGLNLKNARLHQDAGGRNWWPLPRTGMTSDAVAEYATQKLQLPWLDGGSPPPDWKGAPRGTVRGWRVIRS